MAQPPENEDVAENSVTDLIRRAQRRFQEFNRMSPEEQLRQYGITQDQMHSRNIFQDRLAQNLATNGRLEGYGNVFARGIAALNGVQERERGVMEQLARDAAHDPEVFREHQHQLHLLDYGNFYNGISQQFDTFGISDWRPPQNSEIERSAIYYRDNHISQTLRDNLPQILRYYQNQSGNTDLQGNQNEERRISNDSAYFLSDALYGHHDLSALNQEQLDAVGDQLGRFHLSIGRDEKGCYLSYDDKWDINATDKIYEKAKPYLRTAMNIVNPLMPLSGINSEVQNAMINSLGDFMHDNMGTDYGRPMAMYDRIYFDPQTLEAINVSTPTEDLRERIARDSQTAQELMQGNNLHRMIQHDNYICRNDNISHNTHSQRNVRTSQNALPNLVARSGRQGY